MSQSQKSTPDMAALLKSVKACTFCKDLPLGPKPILQGNPAAKVLIAGQAPGRITHNKGIPFDDPSGVRLRQWMGVSDATFYDPSQIAILPMGFCFPGTGKSGDLPPRPECEKAWRLPLLDCLPNIELTLIIGQYAMDWHIADGKKMTLTNRVLDWGKYFPERLPMPHPSPRNNRWLKNNPWFDSDVLPALKQRISDILPKEIK